MVLQQKEQEWRKSSQGKKEVKEKEESIRWISSRKTTSTPWVKSLTSHKSSNYRYSFLTQVKYVLNCIEGIFKNRFLYITTHKDGELLGSGDAKLYGLTLQIEGAGLAPKHAQLKFDGFKNFDVQDFASESGTWMNIPKEGVEVKDGEFFTIGPFVVRFNTAQPVN